MDINDSANDTIFPAWTTRQVILGTLVVLLVVIGFLLIYRFRLMAVIVFSGIVVSMAIAPAVDWLHKHSLSRSLSVITIYLTLLTVLIASVILLVPPIVDQLAATVPKLTAYYQDMRSALAVSPLLALRQIAYQLPAQLTLNPPATTVQAAGSLDSISQVFNATGSILNGLFTLTAVLLIGFYWTLESTGEIRTLFQLLPPDKRPAAREIFREIETRVGGYIRGQGIMVITIGVADFLIFSVIGLPAALSVAVLAGLFEVVPVLGPTLGAIPAVLVAFSYDSSKVIWVIAAGAVVQFLENNLLAPRVMHKTVGVNPIVTLLAIVAAGALFGFAGLLLAIPMAAIIQIIFDRSVLQSQSAGPAVPLGRDRISKLRFDVQELVADIHNLADHKPTGSVQSEVDPVEDTLEAIAMDLDRLLAPAIEAEDAT